MPILIINNKNEYSYPLPLLTLLKKPAVSTYSMQITPTNITKIQTKIIKIICYDMCTKKI